MDRASWTAVKALPHMAAVKKSQRRFVVNHWSSTSLPRHCVISLWSWTKLKIEGTAMKITEQMNRMKALSSETRLSEKKTSEATSRNCIAAENRAPAQ